MSRWIKAEIAFVALMLFVIPACEVFQEDDSPEGIELVEEAWDVIIDEYIDSDELDDHEMAEAAIRGLIDALDDPYTSYLSPEQNDVSTAQLEGNFSGIGAVITVRDGELLVVAPIAASPAEDAGIKPGDKILKVDGELTAELTLVESMMKIRGEKGTRVTLMVLHEDEETPGEIEIVRDTISIPSVEMEMLEDSIAHIKITNFTNQTEGELEEVLDNVKSHGGKGIILDLRDNPGGLVSAAIAVVSQFVDEGIVVYALDNKDERTDWNADAGGVALDIPMTVLVNAYSASASEVVAGALQDYDRGPIIGTTTFGKGSMQHVQDLSNGGSLHVVFARWYTPNGRQIHNEGIVPDIEVEITEEDVNNEHDSQLEEAIEYIEE